MFKWRLSGRQDGLRMATKIQSRSGRHLLVLSQEKVYALPSHMLHLMALQFVLLTPRMLISKPLLLRSIMLPVVQNSASKTLGKIAVIVRALYGGHSANADYWRHVWHAMTELGFQSCKADPDVWFRPSIKSYGTDYYQYVLIFTDDILSIMEDTERFLRDELGNVFTLKEKSIGPPTQYSVNKVSQVTLENVTKCWIFR